MTIAQFRAEANRVRAELLDDLDTFLAADKEARAALEAHGYPAAVAGVVLGPSTLAYWLIEQLVCLKTVLKMAGREPPR